MEAPGPGLYPNVPFDTYTRWVACNHSIIKNFSLTAAHARYRMLNQAESSSHQDLGHALHQALLEPELFEKNVLVAPDVDRRTKIGKAEWASFQEKAKGRTIITEPEMLCLEGIRKNAAAHETINLILNGPGISELSIVWIDPATDLTCKARLDRLAELNGYPFIVDLKTTHKPASTHSWQTAIMQYALHEQAAHYQNGLEVLRPLQEGFKRKYAWIVAETEPPYSVRIFEADDYSLDIGRDQVAKHLAQFRECLEAGVWPSWPQGMELAGLPAWALKRFDLE